ncbi:hypothetical protein [Uliginosibacterium gangwonense]|uniref:hypothetical protein n=1 Tax=Uliginosibacterium gangwonense TaxID=392736 RepID=UPI00037E5452|nr:hypothetical protein [Uliginosibacterium gangwonense]
MKKAWIFLSDRFDVLKPRERLYVFLGVTVCLMLIIYAVALQPVIVRYRKAHEATVQSDLQFKQLSDQEVAMVEASAKDLDGDSKALIKQIQADNARMSEELTKAQAELATSDKMAGVLHDLINSQKGLELVSIRSGTAEDLLAADAAASKPVADGKSIYRQSIEVTVRGDYAALAGYMKKVEMLPWKFYLSDLNLKVDHYPVSTMTLTLNTLSMERAWLGF